MNRSLAEVVDMGFVDSLLNMGQQVLNAGDIRIYVEENKISIQNTRHMNQAVNTFFVHDDIHKLFSQLYFCNACESVYFDDCVADSTVFQSMMCHDCMAVRLQRYVCMELHDTVCSICRDMMLDKTPYKIPTCEHVFHLICIQQAGTKVFEQNNTYMEIKCPLCRQRYRCEADSFVDNNLYVCSNPFAMFSEVILKK